jgi:hypothetical protein
MLACDEDIQEEGDARMHFDVDAVLRNLHCTTPTDPSGHDEPYLWVFFIKLDGSTIRQRYGPDNQPMNRLSATIGVEAGPGGHGNLAAGTASSGSNVVVPPAVGRHQTALRPIPIELAGATKVFRVFVPGCLLALALLIDEDSAPDEAPQAAFAAVKELIANRLNDLINDFDLAGIILGALAALTRNQDPAPGALRAVLTTLANFQQTITQEATDLAIQRAKDAALAASDWWNPFDVAKLAVAAIDPDEVVGANGVLLSEQSLIAASLAQPLSADLRQSATGLGGAWYSLSGSAQGSVKFYPGDLKVFPMGPPKRKDLEKTPFVIKAGRRCLDAGTEGWATRNGFTETHVVSVEYPFLTYRYFLDEIELIGNKKFSNQPGSVQITKTVSFPEFDESKFYLVGETQEVRKVSLKFERATDPLRPQIRQLLIRNDPKDGCYSVTLRVEGVLPNGQTIPVGSTDIAVTGQSLELSDGLLERYAECIAAYLRSLNVRIKPTVPAQWRTPEVKWRQLDLVVERLGELRKANLLDDATVARVKVDLAKKLGLG